MKCQKCSKAATMHITEVLGEEQFEEHHLCEDCAQKYLYEPPKKGGAAKSAESPAEETDELTALKQRECPICGYKGCFFAHGQPLVRDSMCPRRRSIGRNRQGYSRSRWSIDCCARILMRSILMRLLSFYFERKISLK